jgi:hypothetical protein
MRADRLWRASGSGGGLGGSNQSINKKTINQSIKKQLKLASSLSQFGNNNNNA